MERAGDPIRRPDVSTAVAELLRRTWHIPPNELTRIVEVARDVLGADEAKVLVADYGLLSLQALGDGPVTEAQSIEGTLAGRALAHDDVVASGTDPTVVYVPLTEGTERIGVLELSHSRWDVDAAALAGPVAQLLVLLLISKRRYTDAVLRSRRSEPLSTAAEIQWGLASFRRWPAQRTAWPERDPRAGLLHRRRLLRLRDRARPCHELACRPSWPMAVGARSSRSPSRTSSPATRCSSTPTAQSRAVRREASRSASPG